MSSDVQEEEDTHSLAESVLEAFASIQDASSNASVSENPYYWETRYPDEDYEKLKWTTVVSHNIHYYHALFWTGIVNAGFAILSWLGYNQSSYKWIEDSIILEAQMEEELNDQEQRTQEVYEASIKRRRPLHRKKLELP